VRWCAPALRFGLQERLCAATLDLIEALPLEEVRHLESVVEILERAAAYRVPLSGDRASLEPFARAVRDLMGELDRVESPLEYEMHLLLERAGLRGDFAAQQTIPVEFVRRSGLATGSTTPDFTHRHYRLVVFCDGGHHGEVRVRETDNGVVEALQARGYTVLRFTGREILQDAALCLARIRRALEQAIGRSAA